MLGQRMQTETDFVLRLLVKMMKLVKRDCSVYWHCNTELCSMYWIFVNIHQAC